jgi:hypothetical protein
MSASHARACSQEQRSSASTRVEAEDHGYGERPRAPARAGEQDAGARASACTGASAAFFGVMLIEWKSCTDVPIAIAKRG